VQYAHAAGVVLIAASGNQGAGEVAYPARWPETIAAGAITNVGDRWSLSNGGPNLDVMAPGANVWSLKDAAEYQFLSGTSMATPHVSGVAMLLLARDPGLSPDAIKATLQETAADLDAPGFDEQTGFGRIDAAAAVATLAVTGDLDGDGTVSTADLLVLLGAWGPCDEACPPACPADLDGDCVVGTADLLALLANWG
jgi:subtilisin family serine protease